MCQENLTRLIMSRGSGKPNKTRSASDKCYMRQDTALGHITTICAGFRPLISRSASCYYNYNKFLLCISTNSLHIIIFLEKDLMDI